MPNAHEYFGLLDFPNFPADGYKQLADKIAALLNTKNDVLLIQGEAIIALEAVAHSIGRSGLKALNIVTSPYGNWFGNWLKRGGVEVYDLVAEAGKPISIDAVKAALNNTYDIISFVHAESASGIVNPLEDIAALANQLGVLTIVDAVASVGGHDLNVDESGIDIVVIGPQKALAGPAGVSAISISPKAWQFFEHENAPRDSILSIIDQKEHWLDTGRGALPGTPSPLEFFALEAALHRLKKEGIGATIARHQATANQTRQALNAGGLQLWVPDDQGSNLVTTFRLAVGTDRIAFLRACNAVEGHSLAEAVGPGTDMLIRVNHTGQNATQDQLEVNLRAISAADPTFDYVVALEALKIQ